MGQRFRGSRLTGLKLKAVNREICQFLANFAQGKEVECVYAEMDKYNRFLSKCFVDKVSINEALIKNGMAVIYNFNESDEKMTEFEKIAHEQKLGIWKGAFQLPKEYRKAHPRTN